MSNQEIDPSPKLPSVENANPEASVAVPEGSPSNSQSAARDLPAEKKQKNPRGPVFWIVTSILGIAAAIWLAAFIHHALFYEETDDAYVQGHIHLVSARISGDVTQVLVDDNQQVKAGQVLARIDPLEYEIALQRAEASLAQSKAQETQAAASLQQSRADLAQSQAAILQAQSEVTKAAADADVSSQNFERDKRLYGNDARAVAKVDLDSSQGTYKADNAALDGAKANLAAVQAKEQSALANVQAAQAQQAASASLIAVNEAEVRDVQRKLSYTTLTAPADGCIGNKNIETGNRVEAGETLFALVEPKVWIVANFKETKVGGMRRGQPVSITIDTLPGRTFSGAVDSITPATGSEFALLPADNATGNFTKVVQRIPVKIVFDPESLQRIQGLVHPGQSTVVNVRVR